MKNLFLFLALFSTSLLTAQVKGDGNIVTRTFPADNLTRLSVGLYADVTVDQAAPAGITVTADQNLVDLLNLEVNDGRLQLEQREWIKASQRIRIVIGAPNLRQVDVDVHVTLEVQNIHAPEFSAVAVLGKINLTGKTDVLRLSGESGIIDASAVMAPKVDLNLWDDGKVLLGRPDRITGIVKQESQVVYRAGDPTVNVRGGGSVTSLDAAAQMEYPAGRFIKFKVRNNSGKRVNLYVKGPKSDGSTFSYGFPLLPGQKRTKDWTVGSKVYLVSKLGLRKLLVEIEAKDEGEIVDLFGK